MGVEDAFRQGLEGAAHETVSLLRGRRLLDDMHDGGPYRRAFLLGGSEHGEVGYRGRERGRVCDRGSWRSWRRVIAPC